MDGIHYLQRPVGILVFQSVMDELHVGLGRARSVRSSSRQIGSEYTIRLMREAKPNQGVKCKGGIANPRGSVIPASSLSCRAIAHLATIGMTETYQFLVPPMNSGRLNVGLATTAPAEELRDCSRYQHEQTCRFIYKELQRQGASMNSFFPRAIIGGPADPGIPVVTGALQQISKKALWKRE